MLRKTFKKLEDKISENKSKVMLKISAIPISAILTTIVSFIYISIKESNFDALLLLSILLIMAVRIAIDVILNLIRDL